MKYFDYFIKCIIRSFTRILFKPKYFFIIVIILFLIFLLNNQTFAVYTGNDTYTDKNNTIILNYESVVNGFLNRLSSSESSNKERIINLLKNDTYDYYIFYGPSSDGSSMLNGSTFDNSNYYIAFYNDNTSYTPSSNYVNYCGLTTDVQGFSIRYLYMFSGNNIVDTSILTDYIYAPSVLINYTTNSMISFLTNGTQQQTSEIVGALNQQTEFLQDKDTTTAEGEMQSAFESSSSVTSSQDSNFDSINTFFTDILTLFADSLKNEESVEVLSIGIPFTNGSIDIPSNLISSKIKGTLLYNFIQLGYIFSFGMYIILAVWRILLWFNSGQFVNGKFIPTNTILNDMLM